MFRGYKIEHPVIFNFDKVCSNKYEVEQGVKSNDLYFIKIKTYGKIILSKWRLAKRQEF